MAGLGTKKAFDQMWQQGILVKLESSGIKWKNTLMVGITSHTKENGCGQSKPIIPGPEHRYITSCPDLQGKL